jgi:predicted nucleic acid-binding protein
MPGSTGLDFLDSNILVYLASCDAGKAKRSEELLHSGGTISIQVLNEIAHVGRRKMKLNWAELALFLTSIRSLTSVVPLTAETHETGLALAERYGFSVYDGMIIAAALLAGCTRLWSEDMQDGLIVDGVLTIANPYGARDRAD